MVTVIIPALNEQETIGEVVKYCFAEPLVNEVIVVDDQSIDNTKEIAKAAGATVLISEKIGKGLSMKEGILASSNQLLVFLDGDIHPYPAGTIKNLVQPLIDNEYDFVKGAFSRNAGRVTELVAKPLLTIFYPELSTFQQPLSGMIAGKKCFLNKIDFFYDYGVDIGILIDMFLMQTRMKEVNIGYIENKSKPWQMLGKMSYEVAKAIIKKATNHHNNLANLEELVSVNIISSQMENLMKEEKEGIVSLRKMIVFDMDKTLLQGRFIDACADKYLFDEELARLRSIEKDPAVLTKRIAKLLRGLSLSELLQVAASIPLVEDAIQVVEQLKKRGNVIGIISDSYQFVVDYIKNKLGADFALGNQLDFFEGKATGEVTTPSCFYFHLERKCNHPLCKTNALMHIARKYDISLDNCITVGDSENDLCMIEKAGIGIAFCTENNLLRNAADKIIDILSFADLLDTESFYSKKQLALI
jgi:glucosyl-3-phosphoglycerate synthase